MSSRQQVWTDIIRQNFVIDIRAHLLWCFLHDVHRTKLSTLRTRFFCCFLYCFPPFYALNLLLAFFHKRSLISENVQNLFANIKYCSCFKKKFTNFKKIFIHFFKKSRFHILSQTGKLFGFSNN